MGFRVLGFRDMLVWGRMHLGSTCRHRYASSGSTTWQYPRNNVETSEKLCHWDNVVVILIYPYTNAVPLATPRTIDAKSEK